MDSAFPFPASTPSDPSDVALAVETAGALWRQGDSREALKWLRRAAETAESEGDDMRALSLARAAAELKDRLPHLSSFPAPSRSVAPAPSPSVAPLPPPSVVAAPDVPVPVSAPPSFAPPTLAPAAPPSSSLTTDLGLGPVKLEAWSPPPKAVSLAAPPEPDPDPEPQTEPEPEPSQLAAEAVVRAAEPLTPVAPATAPRGPELRPALRVSVEALSSEGGSLLVRVLAEGEKAPAGAREALLVPLEAGVDLRNP